jgi:hypothetical protein
MPSTGSSIHDPKRRHLPAGVFIAVAAALGVFVALLPRTGNQPPPPTVAEFAPQATREIRDSLDDQSSRFGGEETGCANGQVCDDQGRPIKRPEIKVPLVKQCYGEPPRQTPDPQSPPCIPYWVGNNGGPTYQGVTANEIVVAFPTYAFENADHVKQLENHFNKRFQFYGRKLNLRPISARGGLNSQPNPELERADAKDVDELYHAFASISTGGRFGSEHHYYDALAERGVLSVAHRAGTKTTEAYLAARAPYRWSVVPGMDVMQIHMAKLVCSVLHDRPPSYAGPGITAGKRVFGLVSERAGDGSVPDLDDFRARVATCGVELAVDTVNAETGAVTDRGGGTVLKLIEKGVTSVVCFCDATNIRGSMMPAASGQQYRPEWIVSTYIDADVENAFALGNAPSDQANHVIGLSFRNKWLPREYMPWYWAYKDGNPESDVAVNESYNLTARYSSLLLLASGIQAAGPNLTPQTFEAGLHRLSFPNPGAKGPPYFQSFVGFPNGSHTMIRDATMYWFSQNEQGTVDRTNVGAICHVDRGKRYELSDWPERQEPRFYSGSCRS